MTARCLRQLLCLALLALLGACNQLSLRPEPGSEQAAAYWHGRLALRVESAPEPENYSASFELSGNAHRGELLLLSPLGTTLARLSWSPGWAQLQSKGQTRLFDSLDVLVAEALGTDLPIAALFEWLQGHAVAAQGWQAELQQLDQGRLRARRLQPAPKAELQLLLLP